MTKSIPPSISWHEGMLLSPQHFQEMDRRHESLLHFHVGYLNPFHWGVISRQIDEAMLANGILRILALEAVLPDGLVIQFRAEENFHLEIDLHDQFESLKALPQKIYLAVVSEQGGNADQKTMRRYRGIEGGPVNDANGDGNPVNIPRLLPEIRIVLGKPSKLFTALPLCEVTYRDNVVSLTSFCAPALTLSRDSEIGRICHSQVAAIRRKANHLAGVLASGDRADEHIIRESETTLKHLVAGLPRMEALLGVPSIHPFITYLAMVDLLASIVNLSKTKIPPQLEPYDHDDPLTSFRELEGYIKTVLDQRIQESFSLNFFKRESQMYTLPFRSDWLNQDLVLGFSKEAGTTDNDAEAWVSGAIIGARSLTFDLRQQRVLGVERESVEKVIGLVPPEGTLLFRLHKNEWINIDEDLVVLPASNYTGQLKPLSLTLYVRNPESEKGDS